MTNSTKLATALLGPLLGLGLLVGCERSEHVGTEGDEERLGVGGLADPERSGVRASPSPVVDEDDPRENRTDEESDIDLSDHGLGAGTGAPR